MYYISTTSKKVSIYQQGIRSPFFPLKFSTNTCGGNLMMQIILYNPGTLRNYITRYVLPMLSVKNLFLPTVEKKNLCASTWVSC